MFPRSALVAPLLWLAACSAAEKSPPPSDGNAIAGASSSTPPVVTIIARDFSYEAPDTIAGGMVTLKLVNEGPDLHHVQLLRLTDGKSYADLMSAMQSMTPGSAPPSWIQDVAGPNSPVPGGEVSLTQELAPGNYAIVCFIDTPDKVPHVAKGMTRSLTVVPPTEPSAAAPVADITVDMSDYAWSVSPELTAGKHVIKLTNSSPQSHEMFIAQLAPGKSAADMMQWADTYQGPPPGTPMGGISGMAPGAEVYLQVDLPAGQYLLLCFLPDAKDGKPHIAHGMIRTITVS